MIRAMHGAARALVMAAGAIFGAAGLIGVSSSPCPPAVAKRKNKPNRAPRYRSGKAHEPQRGRLIRRAFQ